MADVSDSQEHPVLESAELQIKKKRLLEELESALAPKDAAAAAKTVTALPSSLALGIEVIDETALLDSVVKNGGPKHSASRRRGPKNNNNINSVAHSLKKIEERPKSKPTPKSGNSNDNKYSRKDLEALRFVNLSQQRKFWKAIHAAFESAVASEYDTLASTPLPNNKPILSESFFLSFFFGFVVSEFKKWNLYENMRLFVLVVCVRKSCLVVAGFVFCLVVVMNVLKVAPNVFVILTFVGPLLCWCFSVPESSFTVPCLYLYRFCA